MAQSASSAMLRTAASSSLSALPRTVLLCSKLPMIPSDRTAARRAATSVETDRMRHKVPSLYRAATRLRNASRSRSPRNALKYSTSSDPLCASDMLETPIPRRGVSGPTETPARVSNGTKAASTHKAKPRECDCQEATRILPTADFLGTPQSRRDRSIARLVDIVAVTVLRRFARADAVSGIGQSGASDQSSRAADPSRYRFDRCLTGSSDQDVSQREPGRAGGAPSPNDSAIGLVADGQGQAEAQVEVDQAADQPGGRRGDPDEPPQVLAARAPGGVQRLGAVANGRCRTNGPAAGSGREPARSDRPARRRVRSGATSRARPARGKVVVSQVGVQADADDRAPAGLGSRSCCGEAAGWLGARRVRPGCRRSCGRRRGRRWAT